MKSKHDMTALPRPACHTASSHRLRIRIVHAALAVALATASAASHAQWLRFEQDFDEQKPWQEIALQLPAAPKPENLAEFEVSSTTRMSFAVDTQSISTGEDGVVRYTLVSRSPSGATNISYEGIRCETQERKLYAFGQKDGSWTRARNDQWERFTQTISNSQHAALARDYFCDHRAIAGNANELRRNLRNRPVSDRYLPK